MKNLLKLAICLFAFTLTAQTSIKKVLDTITTLDQAEKFLETKKSRKNKILVFNEEKHKTKLAKSLFNNAVGSAKAVKSEFTTTHYKIVDKTNLPHYRISYIYLDGNKLDASKIVEYKNEIMQAYDRGTRFDNLAKRYSMDKNSKLGGDSGWLKEDSLPILLEDEVFNLAHKINSIYTVRIPETKAYYIVVKTHRIKKIKEIKVLKIVEN